jgi:ATP-dependent RNA helicase MSS116
MGFRPAIEQMLKALPSKESRQNLLFSATFPAQVDTISKIAMRCQGKGKYQMIDTIGDEEVPTHKIPQTHLITSIEEQLPTVMCVLAQQAKKPDHKVIVFLPTARQTQLFAEVFNALADLKVFKSKCLEIHSRKSQPQRTRASEEFRNSSKVILFSSDVSARGMDYPDVTFVLQCGVPSDKAQYVHRLGRTARAGKSGSGLLVLADFEKYFLNMIKDLPIKPDKAVDRAELDKMWYSVEDALANAHRANPQLGGMAYQAWMGFYNSYLGKLHWTKNELVEQANYYATECLKLAQIPALEPKTVGKMGLKGTPGLVIERRPPK